MNRVNPLIHLVPSLWWYNEYHKQHSIHRLGQIPEYIGSVYFYQASRLHLIRCCFPYRLVCGIGHKEETYSTYPHNSLRIYFTLLSKDIWNVLDYN